MGLSLLVVRPCESISRRLEISAATPARAYPGRRGSVELEAGASALGSQEVVDDLRDPRAGLAVPERGHLHRRGTPGSEGLLHDPGQRRDRKSTRLNSSH